MIREILADPTGQPSTMRLSTLITTLAILAGWLWGCYHAETMIALEPTAGGLLFAVLGLKTVQRGVEREPRPSQLDHVINTIAERVDPVRPRSGPGE